MSSVETKEMKDREERLLYLWENSGKQQTIFQVIVPTAKCDTSDRPGLGLPGKLEAQSADCVAVSFPSTVRQPEGRKRA